MAANPVKIPGFKLVMRGTYREETPMGDGTFFDVLARNPVPDDTVQKTMNNCFDPFYTMPLEIKNAVLLHLSSKDISALRLASRSFHQIPEAIFRKLIKEEMSWFWEVDEMKREEEHITKAYQESYDAETLQVYFENGHDRDMLAFVKAQLEKPHLNTNWLRVYNQLKIMERGLSDQEQSQDLESS